MRRCRVVWQMTRETGIWSVQQGLNHCYHSESLFSEQIEITADVATYTRQKAPANGHKLHEEINP
jgi:uncharacterized damage-inducible protein DinB